MKNQYFGDIHDYIKYGLLRQLSRSGKISTAVCWMLTQNDDRGDGHRVNYLSEPAAWREFDPPIFDCLQAAVLNRKERNVKAVEESGLLSNTIFYSPLLTDSSDERIRYFDGLVEFSRGRQLVFFDPDNGLEIKSVKYGRKGASRYLYLREVSQSFSAGHSLLIYQHMPPKPRDPFISDLVSSLTRKTGSNLVYVFRTQAVAFLLVPQSGQAGQFEEIASRVQSQWAGFLNTRRYLVKNGTISTRTFPVRRSAGCEL